jgi:hypothetical protein
MGKRTKLGFGASVLFLATVVRCGDHFTGPYPCVAGYASCNGNNACETQVSSDPRHCGTCDQVCPQGGLCNGGACTASPPILATDAAPGLLAINATYVFYWSTSGMIVGLPKRGGAPLYVYPQNTSSGSSGIPFAVDDTSVYYVGQVSGSGSAIVAQPAAPADGGAASRVVATIPSSSGFQGSTQLTLAGGTLFLLVNNNNQTLVASVPTTGGTLTKVTTFVGGVMNTPLVDASGIYQVMPANQGPCDIDRAPSTGGDPSALLQTNNCPYMMATDGKSLYWANASSYGSNKNGPMKCMLETVRASVSGANPTILASIETDEVPLQVAVDASSVYVATDQSLWKVPSGDGAVTRLAGNLGTSQNGGFCGQRNGNGNTVSLAVDDTTVYALVGGANRSEQQVLLAIPK